MARIGIESDEWYPVFTFERDPRHPGLVDGILEMDEETLERWQKVFEQFEVMQAEMRAALESAPARASS